MLTPNTWVAWRNRLVGGVPYRQSVLNSIVATKYNAALATYQSSGGDMQYWDADKVTAGIAADVQPTIDLLFGTDANGDVDALLYQLLVGFLITNAEVASGIAVTVDPSTGSGATTGTGTIQ